MANEQEALQIAVGRVLEDWALMMIDPLDDTTQLFETDADFYVASVHFRCEDIMDGSVSVLCHPAFMETLGKSLLGLSPDESLAPGENTDALAEMANVLAGNFLTEAFGDGVIFDLFPPEVGKADDSVVKHFRDEETLFVLADSVPVATRFDADLKEKHDVDPGLGS